MGMEYGQNRGNKNYVHNLCKEELQAHNHAWKKGGYDMCGCGYKRVSLLFVTVIGFNETGTWIDISSLQSIKEAWNAAVTFVYLLRLSYILYATSNEKTWDWS